jgi:eukaryotic-like serine/threonine-protein kinase
VRYASTVNSIVGQHLERDALLLFSEAIERDLSGRDAWLKARCGDDSALLTRVRRLMAADAASNTALASRLTTQVLGGGSSAAVLPPSQVGVYQLAELIGVGGMGSVYRARRNDGLFEQAVAIKFIRPRSGTMLLGPFMDAERRLLARMTHSGIARILDGGSTTNGLPYVVMELVDGDALDVYLDTKLPDLHARVALMRQVCDAVAHAHQNLVLHCDIKPANILVPADGQPKLIDFGVARGQDLIDTRAQGFTQTYTSPQRLAGEPAVTTDDVFSLGVVLRDALLNPPTDLRAIIDKATSPAREDRYAGVDALTDDLTRWQERRPVQAMQAGRSHWRYVAAKFVQRYPGRVLSASLAALGLIGALIAITLLYARADAARGDAEQRFSEVRALANFMLFDLDAALETIPGTTRARRDLVGRSQKYLDALAASASGDVGLQVEVARGLTRLGEVQGVPGRAHVGEPAAAKLSLQRAETMLIALSAASPADGALQRDLARAKYLLALAYGGIDNDVNRQLVKAKEAEQHAVNALKLASTGLPTTAELAEVELLLLGTRLVQADSFKYNNNHAAAALLQSSEEARMLALPESIKGAMAFEYQSARPAMLLGDSLWYQKKFDEALAAYRRATERMEQGLAKSRNDRRLLNGALQGYWNMSGALLDVGAPAADALAVIDKGAVLGERLLSLDPDNVDAMRMLGVVINQRALILSKLGRHDEAIAVVEARLASSESRIAKAPDDAERARDPVVILRSLAELFEARGDSEKACRSWRRADAGWQALEKRWTVSALDRKNDVATVRAKVAACRL